MYRFYRRMQDMRTTFPNNNGKCNECETGYHLVESKCEKILCPSIDHCSLCQSEDKCAKCDTGYKLDSAKKCKLCAIDYEQDPDSEEFKCRKIDCSHIQHCTKCKTSYECETCEESFKGSLCSICAEGFQPYVSDDGFFCIDGESCNDKVKNCIVCQSDTECQQCQLPYTGPKCDECIYGYKKDDENAHQFYKILISHQFKLKWTNLQSKLKIKLPKLTLLL